MCVCVYYKKTITLITSRSTMRSTAIHCIMNCYAYYLYIECIYIKLSDYNHKRII